MLSWWASLTAAEQIFAYVAIPATMILLLQTLLMLFGLGDHDSDTDGGGPDHDMISDHDLPADTVDPDAHLPEFFHHMPVVDDRPQGVDLFSLRRRFLHQLNRPTDAVAKARAFGQDHSLHSGAPPTA